MNTPKLLDLYCCAGGASKGYFDAGFYVVGVDNKPQPKYPFEFKQGDAIKYLMDHWREFDAFALSPPCQLWTVSTQQWRKEGNVYPDLIGPTRNILLEIDKPYVIENVVGAPLIDPIMLCGAMFGLKVYRHRIFESNCELIAPPHPEHIYPQCKMGRPPKPGEFIQPVGHFSGVQYARDAMGIQWMGQKELAQAIPPAYTEYIGKQLLLFT